jgi:hypothetical protein
MNYTASRPFREEGISGPVFLTVTRAESLRTETYIDICMAKSRKGSRR